jgi:oligoendopeptidase F
MPKTLPARTELDSALTWDLSVMFSSDGEWEAAFTAVQKDIAEFPKFSGTLGKSPETLLAALKREGQISLALERLYVYAHMRRDEDNAVPKYQGMTDRAMQQGVAFGAAASFFTPEVLEIDPATLRKWIDGDVLKEYRRVLNNVERARPHTLTRDEEKLLALAGEPLAAADSIFTMLNNADIRFGEIQNDEGERVELTQGNYRSFIESKNRAVRESAYKTLYAAYTNLKNTLSASYSASVKADVFYARARKYESAIGAALYGSNVPLSVYDGLIEAVESRLPTLGKYLDLRRKALGVDELRMYDLYVPVVPEVQKRMEYEEAKTLVKAALAPLGPDYAKMLDTAYCDRWIDVVENRGKTTGAYSWGAYGTHPFVLLNYQPEADYAFTLAHELGHAMHTHYSDTALPYQDAQYKIMAAEVASTVNEVLLTRYLLSKETDKARRAYLLNHFLEQFRTTVYRQTMFAAFERESHRMCEAGEPLTVESLCEAYGKLNEKYYPGVVVDDEIKIEWARIPHFYNAFYVYQYATGFCAAVALARGILECKGLDAYLAFLKSGGSDFPIALLQKAGVDLTKPESILTSLDEFDNMVGELSKLV